MQAILIDNYDSFTFNLLHLVAGLGVDIDVERNDQITVGEVLSRDPDLILLSPGPCTPTEAGICVPLIEAARGRVPIFGVCLGLQSIGQALGGRVVRAPQPMHGKVSAVRHGGRGLFREINGPVAVARYHSLVVERASCPAELDIEAESEDGLIMALSHRTEPLWGVQFHPESIASEHGATLCKNVLDMAQAFRHTASRPASQPLAAPR